MAIKYTVTDINTMFADNNVGQITAKKLRDFALSVIDGFYGGAVEEITEVNLGGVSNTGWAYANDPRTEKAAIGEGATDFSVVLSLTSRSSSSSSGK